MDKAYVFFDRTDLNHFVVVVASSDRLALGKAAEQGIHIGSEGESWDMIEADMVL